jgi:FkbM family methyltransferase
MKNDIIKFLNSNNIPVCSNKIDIPKQFRIINFDIGLSFSACHTQQWIKNNDDVFVIAIEAHPDNVRHLHEGIQTTFYHRKKSHYLNKKHINTRCYILPCAVCNSNTKKIGLYNTRDTGQCSIYTPPSHSDKFEYEGKIDAPAFKLIDIINVLPLERIDIIGYIKVDTQGSDLEVIKSGENILKEKVAYITMESDTKYGSGDTNSRASMVKYMRTLEFDTVKLPNVNDITFLNRKFRHMFPPHEHNIICIQNN